jgi:hypothetical protein
LVQKENVKGRAAFLILWDSVIEVADDSVVLAGATPPFHEIASFEFLMEVK